MSKDKYPSIFSRQMEAIVFIIFQIFFPTRRGLKIGEYSCDTFRPIAREQKYLMDYTQTMAFIWHKNMLAKDICPWTLSVPRSKHFSKSIEEQIMSKDKYPSIFSPQMEAIVFIIAVLKIGEYSRIFPSFSWGMFSHVTCLDQSSASKNI